MDNKTDFWQSRWFVSLVLSGLASAIGAISYFAGPYLDAPWLHSGVLGYMIDGGPFMWPILVLAVVGLAVSIERYRSLQMLTVDNQGLRDEVLELLHANRGEEALELCNKSRGPVPAILSVGLRKFLMLRRLNYDPGKIQEQVSKAMDDYGALIVAALEKHLPMLAVISSVAPMLGSVGTVVGMVVLFDALGQMSSSDPIVQVAAAGIKIKLLVTVWGLLVGIPAYIAFNYFSEVINRYVLQVEETATELFEAVTLRIALEQQQAAVKEVPSLGENTAVQSAVSGGKKK